MAWSFRAIELQPTCLRSGFDVAITAAAAAIALLLMRIAEIDSVRGGIGLIGRLDETYSTFDIEIIGVA